MFVNLGGIHFLALPFQDLGKVTGHSVGGRILAVELEKLAGGRNDVLIAGKDQVPIEQFEHDLLMTRVIAVSLNEGLARPH